MNRHSSVEAKNAAATYAHKNVIFENEMDVINFKQYAGQSAAKYILGLRTVALCCRTV